MVMYITWYEQVREQADPPIVMGKTYKAPPTVPVSNGRLAHVQQNAGVPGCVFRAKADGDSDARRTLIPTGAGQ
jgi:hypothetical protein